MRFTLALSVFLFAASALAGAPPKPEDAKPPAFDDGTLGALTLGMDAATAVKALGEPAKKTPPVFQGADGMWVSDWSWPTKGVTLTMSAGKKDGPQTVSAIVAEAPCTFATKRGIAVGSAEADVRSKYADVEFKDAPPMKDRFVAGSIYGGIVFQFESAKVESIFLGAAAE